MNVPLALYVHLPWCVRKCPYCDFNSHTAGREPATSRYVDALCRDLDEEARRARGRPLVSVFLGGGTPSLFSGAEIGRILENVRARFTVAADAEITMEANPGTVERHDLAGYRSAGVNRLSLGAQSFNDASLERLGRIHTAAETVAAFREARGAGFDNVNLDLMVGLPGQTRALALNDVARALELDPEHVSCYQLTLEPNTVFYSRPPADLPGEDEADALLGDAQATLERAGYRRYEVSAFAKAGRACRHNLNYWSFGDYLGAGAGAHGKITDGDGRIWRYRKPGNPVSYMNLLEGGPTSRRGSLRGGPVPTNRPRPTQPTRLSDEEIAFEYLLNALRLPDGFSEQAFIERTGLAISRIAGALGQAAADGLMERPAPGRWRPSRLGFRFLNDLQARFLPA